MPNPPRPPELPCFQEVSSGSRDVWLSRLGYTFWNLELIAALAERLRAERVPQWVELAAGTGVLAAALERRGVPVIATDNRSQGAGNGSGPGRGGERPVRFGASVRPLDWRDAVAELAPEGVLCAWPPLGTCLVPDLLAGRGLPAEAHGKLRIAVCIGEPDGASEITLDPGLLPPGWEPERWPECERWLVGFTDPLPMAPGRSLSRLAVYRRR